MSKVFQILAVLAFSGSYSFSQSDFIIVIGPVESDTVITSDGSRIIYSKSSCNIVCYNSGDSLKWEINLEKKGCEFGVFSYLNNSDIKGCDIFIRKDRTLMYGIKSKTGRMKKITLKYIQRKNKKYAYRK